MSREPFSTLLKDPNAVQPEGFNWTDFLTNLGSGVTIANSTWLVDGPTGTGALTVTDDGVVVGGLRTQAVLRGGVVGKRYFVTNRVTANDSIGTTEDRSFWVVVEER